MARKRPRTEADDSVAAEVRAIRTGLGMTLERLAAEMGFTMRAVQHWEAGARRPSKLALAAMRRMRDEQSTG